MILGAHVIFSAYGFWLSNDPRGSWSDFIRAWELLKYGNATKIEERRSVARRPHNSALRAAAKRELMYPPVIFNGRQAVAIAYGFGDVVRRTGCVIYACAIMPDHVHLVIGRHHYPIQQVANLLKGGEQRVCENSTSIPSPLLAAARRAELGLELEFASIPLGHNFWKVWLDSEVDVHRSINYVNENPIKQGFTQQNWKFVVPYASR